jgi:hypothetical protein
MKYAHCYHWLASIQQEHGEEVQVLCGYKPTSKLKTNPKAKKCPECLKLLEKEIGKADSDG